MDHRGRHYGKVRKSYIVNTLRNNYGVHLGTNTQKIIFLKKINEKDLESRAKNS